MKKEFNKEERRTVGIVGVPHWEELQKYVKKGDTIIDLDDSLPDVSVEDSYLPKTYCSILKRVASNAITLAQAGRLHLVLADVGEGKCDGMRYIASFLRELLPIPVVEVRNTNSTGAGFPICQSQLPLREKMELIVETVSKPLNPSIKLRRTTPSSGFWGVPPSDFALLELFPPNTHIYGWTRCMENKTPANRELELEVDDGVPTVFFSQNFCQRSALAFHLARRHQGLFVQMDHHLTKSIRAMVEAFIKFNVS